jgi:hypothetical protein
MELYTLDSLLRRTEVIDRFESLIWTERYSKAGDFELHILSDSTTRDLLQAGTRLALSDSYRVMTVEEIEDKDDSEGRSLLTVKGPSLEAILDDRTTRGAGPGTTGDTTKWTFTNINPVTIINNIFNSICVTNTAIAADKIPFYTTGSLYPADTIAAPTDVIATFDVPTDTLYSIFTQIADAYGIGFRLYRSLDTSKIYFNVYTGSDRTTKQTNLPPVIFSSGLDTLAEVSVLTTATAAKNVAYVYAPNGSAVVYSPGYESVTGFDRRVLNVNASDITLAAGAALDAALQQRGKDELAKYKTVRAIDGQVPQTTLFKYGVDYNLGDLVEMRNDDGVASLMTVTEHIFVSDSEGERSYPTLAENLFLVPGSWNAYDISKTWDNVDATLTWNTI